MDPMEVLPNYTHFLTNIQPLRGPRPFQVHLSSLSAGPVFFWWWETTDKKPTVVEIENVFSKKGGKTWFMKLNKNKEWEGWAGVLVDLRVKSWSCLISKMCYFVWKFLKLFVWVEIPGMGGRGKVSGPCPPPKKIDQFFVIFVSKQL